MLKQQSHLIEMAFVLLSFLSMSKNCPNCHARKERVSKFGYFYRKSDRKKLRRYKCNICKKTFSQATFQSCFNQNKRQLNPIIEKLLVSCVSQRRIAKLLNISRTTVERKFRFLSEKAEAQNIKLLKSTEIFCFQFDDLETFEHSKLKPVSVTMAVENVTRKILGFEVAQMPAKGLLAKRSREKYGYRKDERSQKRKLLFEKLKPQVNEKCEIWSDENPFYTSDVKKFFPECTHLTTKGRRGCVVGQGELKAGGYDPLFTLNHTFAMLRANINRLVRKTWCTSKTIPNLKRHLDLYMYYHNTRII